MSIDYAQRCRKGRCDTRYLAFLLWGGREIVILRIVGKAKGSSINHMVNFFGIFTPSLFIFTLFNKAYVIKWSFDYIPSPLTVHVVYGCPPTEK